MVHEAPAAATSKYVEELTNGQAVKQRYTRVLAIVLSYRSFETIPADQAGGSD